MWREHDATLAALWRRDDAGPGAHLAELATDPAHSASEPPDAAEPVARPV